MSVGITDVRRQAIVTELTNWPKKRKGFTLLQGITIYGNFELWASTSPWFRFLHLALRSSANNCLHACSKIAKNKCDIKIMIEIVVQWNNSSDLQVRFFFSVISVTYINKTLRSELKIMKKILSHPLQYNLETSIAHLVPRDPDFVTYGDACLEAAGGFSEDLKFWWHTEFLPSIKSKILKNLTVTRHCPLSQELVFVNLLEFLN